ncbi:hypothetical protein D3C87_1672370 [compost metagenome]
MDVRQPKPGDGDAMRQRCPACNRHQVREQGIGKRELPETKRANAEGGLEIEA